MKCGEIQRKLPDYLAGELNESRAAIAEHLLACPSCRQVADEFQSVNRLLDQWEIALPPMDFRSNILEAITAGEKPQENVAVEKPKVTKLSSMVRDMVVAAAAALLIFWGGGSWFGDLGQPEKPSNPKVSVINNSVEGLFRSYVNLSQTAMGEISQKLDRINYQNKGGLP